MPKISRTDRFFLAFISLVMILCLVPLVGMIFAPTNSTTENKPLAELPSLFDDGKLNTDYLSQLGVYFNDHFALRRQLVSADSAIRCKLFGVSTMDSVIVGKDGWLFYSDTVSDFCGSSPMSDRQLFNIANNLAITQRFVQSRGASFIFTIAPNKNTLYPQYMPYTMTAAERSSHNAARLARPLSELGVTYVDLFELFDSQNETLYLARDSHWNNKGALLAANQLLLAAGRADAVYTDIIPDINENYIGDLNRMLFPNNPVPETNQVYGIDGYRFTNGARAVDDPIIVTSASDVSGSLVIYRDSFGNTLLPFLANAYSSACFLRTVPCNLSLYMDLHQPDTVIFEKVERSIDELSVYPPLLETENTELLISGTADSASVISLCQPEENAIYWRFDGSIDGELADVRSRIFIKLTFDDGNSLTREAFTVTNTDGDFGFRMYLSKEAVSGKTAAAEVLAAVNGKYMSFAACSFVFDPAEEDPLS